MEGERGRLEEGHLCVSVMIYLVSFEPNLPLLSRNPNFTLMQEDGGCGQKEKETKNIRGNCNALRHHSHLASSTDTSN